MRTSWVTRLHYLTIAKSGEAMLSKAYTNGLPMHRTKKNPAIEARQFNESLLGFTIKHKHQEAQSMADYSIAVGAFT